jgi:hypothetical protein
VKVTVTVINSLMAAPLLLNVRVIVVLFVVNPKTYSEEVHKNINK